MLSVPVRGTSAELVPRRSLFDFAAYSSTVATVPTVEPLRPFRPLTEQNGRAKTVRGGLSPLLPGLCPLSCLLPFGPGRNGFFPSLNHVQT